MIRRAKRLRSRLRGEFYAIVGELLEHELVQKLDGHTQHHKFTRLRHSLDVAYLSFVVARFLRFDYVSVARAGLLHDLFFHEENQSGVSLLFSHPRIALENARKVTELNAVEENIILRHMWMLTPIPPRYKEGFLVSFMDKYCASREFITSLFTRRTLIDTTGLRYLPKTSPASQAA